MFVFYYYLALVSLFMWMCKNLRAAGGQHHPLDMWFNKHNYSFWWVQPASGFTRFCFHVKNKWGAYVLAASTGSRERPSMDGATQRQCWHFRAANCRHCSCVTRAVLAHAVLTCVLCLPVRKLCVQRLFPCSSEAVCVWQVFADCYTDGPTTCQTT